MREIICGCGQKNSEFDAECIKCGEELPVITAFAGGEDVPETRTISHYPDRVYLEDGLFAGDQLAHFEIVEKVGAGGMGTVYKARDLQLDRFVALKIFRPLQLHTGEGQEYLLKEAKLAGSLNHANIVTIFDVARDETDRISFIAMEWLEGKTLDKLVPKQGLPVVQAMDYARKTAAGLAAAHERGIIHRDIKPQNLMITPDDNVKILDFGVAYWRKQGEPGLPEVSETLEQGSLRGTMPYMAPEQIQGQETDERSDIFAFGVLLYQMLAGERPFSGPDFKELSFEILTKDPKPVDQIRDDIPPEVASLVARCLSKNPAARYGSMRELIEDLPSRRSDFNPMTTPKARRFMPWAAIAVLALTAILWLATRPAEDSAMRLAILPFHTNSGDPLDSVFSDGVTADVTTQLTRIAADLPEVWVAPASEIQQLSEPSALAAYERFAVDAVITGDIRNLGDQRRLRLDLIGLDPVRQIASRTLVVNEQELFELQDRVLREVLVLLDWSVSTRRLDELTDGGATVTGAYRHFLFGQGYLYRYDRRHNVDAAIDAMNSAIDEDPDYVPALLALSEAYRLKWRATQERIWLDRAFGVIMRVSPDSYGYEVERFTQLGLLHQALGDTDKAVDSFDAALELQPDHTQALNGMAAVYKAQGRPKDAERVLLRALEAEPNDWSTRIKLGNLYFGLGWFDRAEKAYTEILEATPNNSVILGNLGATLTYLGKEDAALAILDRAIELAPSSSLYNNQGMNLFMVGRYEDAVVAYREAVALNPNSHIIWSNLAGVYQRLEQRGAEQREAYEKALELTEADLDKHPTSLGLRISRSLYLAKLERTNEALNGLGEIDLPEDPQLLYQLCMIYLAAGRTSEASFYLDKTIEHGYPVELLEQDPDIRNLMEVINLAKSGK